MAGTRDRPIFQSRRAVLLVAAVTLATAVRGGAQTGYPPDSVLARRVTIHVRNATLGDALARLRHDQGVPLAYSGDILPADHRVTLVLNEEPLGAALAALLAGSGLDVAVTRQGSVVIVPRDATATPSTPAEVNGTTTDVDRVLLATGVRHLDQIVVMGTAVAGAPEREQATAVAVVGRATLARAPHTRMADLVRTLLPGVVLWDRGPGGPPAQITAVRGVSSFTSRALKTYVDGVELASPELFTLVDGRTIERIEVIRGPQGAALYGPDAISGVLQIVTRKGSPGVPGLQPRAAASAGPHERSDQSSAALLQDHALGLTGGASRVGFDLAGSFSQAGSSGGVPWLRAWSANGGGKALLGPVVLSASARLGRYEYGLERPVTSGTTPTISAPQELEERGIGLTLTHGITAGWRQTLVVGHHWISGAREASRPPLLTPRLPLGATHETAWRTSVRYSSAWDLEADGLSATISAGAEHGRRHVERAVRRTVTARDLSPLYGDDLTSTGAFGQVRLRPGTHLVASAGTRAEWSSSVGSNEGAALASTAGASWSLPLGRTTLVLRGAWGRGLRPPEPGMSRAMATATIRQEPNPDLEPETQTGVEIGAELHVGDGGYARITGYDQRANDLIQQVAFRPSGDATQVYQFQNVGAIANRGVELEAGARWRRVTLTGLLYVTDSELRRRARGYTGELQPGDDLLEVPKAVGAASLRYDIGRLRAEAGGTWLGGWTGYDWAALLAVDQGQAPARPTIRDYWMRYPGVFRPYVSASVGFGGDWSAFIRIDNPGKTASLIRDNVSPPLGRTTLLGIELEPQRR